jgi:flagellar biogenesis protein FliO
MIRRAVPALLLLLVAVAAEPVSAGYTPPQAPPAPDAGPLLLRLFGMTLFVLLLCAGVLWVVRRLGRPRLTGTGSDKLKLLESAWLGRRCSLHLVRAGTCRVLIAVDPTGMKTCQLVDEDFAGFLPTAEPRDMAAPSVAEIMSMLAAGRPAA